MSSSEIQVNLPKSMLNDTDFIKQKLAEVSISTLYEIAKHTDKNLIDLILVYIPEIDTIDESILKKWDLSHSMFKDQESLKTQDDSETSTPLDNSESNEMATSQDNSKLNPEAKSKKKIKISIKKN